MIERFLAGIEQMMRLRRLPGKTCLHDRLFKTTSDVSRPVALIGLSLGLISLSGCDGGKTAPTPPARPFANARIVVGIVGDPAILPSIRGQRGEWAAKTGADLEVRDKPVDINDLKGVDVLVFPGDRMGDLADLKALAVLPDAFVNPPEPNSEGSTEAKTPKADPFAYVDILKAYRDQVSRHGNVRLGLPIGGSALVVAFRRSAFDAPKNKEAAKEAGLTLEPPKSWEQFDALARFFHGRDWDNDGMPESGVALAWSPDAEGLGESIFLARSTALALHPDQYSSLFDSDTTEPRVASPPFVETLKALVALKDLGPAGPINADAAREAFRKGEVAMLIDRAERASTWSTEGVAIGVSPLPGSNRVFDPSGQVWEERKTPNRPSYLPSGGGWLVGVVASSTNRGAAEDFARYLAEPDSTNRLRAEAGFPMLAVRTSQLAQGLANPRSTPGVEARSWADSVSKTLTAEKVVPGLRIPGTAGYLADLSKARVSAFNGEPAEAALKGLAKAWADRTRSLGQARQTWHHRRSLNGPSTSPEPPAR